MNRRVKQHLLAMTFAHDDMEAAAAGGDREGVDPAVQLEWFAERSGVVLINMDYYGFFWLDLHSMKIVR
ncbi:hypothetical protein ACP70R_004906 [Stipagrostis hirtigluma subsp. patula]